MFCRPQIAPLGYKRRRDSLRQPLPGLEPHPLLAVAAAHRPASMFQVHRVAAQQLPSSSTYRPPLGAERHPLKELPAKRESKEFESYVFMVAAIDLNRHGR